jgi:hypothetical protein
MAIVNSHWYICHSRFVTGDGQIIEIGTRLLGTHAVLTTYPANFVDENLGLTTTQIESAHQRKASASD